MPKPPLRSVVSALLPLALFVVTACGGDDDAAQPDASEPTKASGELIFATTTTTQDSGLMDMLVPLFEQQTGYSVKLIVGGSGQVIAQAARGDADVVLAHSPAAEQAIVDSGDGIERTLVMHNDFIIIGPEADPAGVRGAASAADAVAAIAAEGAPFVSRGDDSGTHVLELKLWAEADVEPRAEDWYAETGQGQGATMQVANQRRAYAITDRGTFLAQKDNLGDLTLLFEGDAALLNVYHAVLVDPAKHPDVNATAARAFLEFLVSPDTQARIGEFGIVEFGQPLFLPDAGKAEPGG